MASINPLAIYAWIKDNIDLESDRDAQKQDIINGLAHHFRINNQEASRWLDNFFKSKYEHEKDETKKAFEGYEQKVSGSTEDLIDYNELEPKKVNGKKRMVCRACKKEIPESEEQNKQQYCNDDCRQRYINNIILFWKPDILAEEANGRDLTILQQESRLAFMNLVRDVDPEELVLRIKVLRHVVREAYEIGFDALHRDKLREKLDEEFSVKGTAKRLVEERDKAKQENVELRRQIAEIEKSGDKVQKHVKQAVKAGSVNVTGKCMICGKETIRETCSPEHREQWKAVQSWMKIGFSEAKARETVNQIAEAAKVKEIIDGATESESGPN